MGSAESHSSESNSESLPQQETLDPQSLLTSAAEIVARQRLAEQLVEEQSTASGVSNPLPSTSRDFETNRRPRTATLLTSNTQTAARRSHFSTIRELLEDLLEHRELRFDNCWHVAHRNLNMYTNGVDSRIEDSSSSSDDDEFLSASSCPARFCDQGVFMVSQEPRLQKSYFELINDVSLRSGYCDKFVQATSIKKESNSNKESALVCPNSIEQKPLTNLPRLIFKRELGFSRGPTSSHNVPSSYISRPYTCSFTSGQRVFLNNQFIPNQRRQVDMVKSKTFCVSYIENGEGLITASQDHRIRLYRRKGPRRQFIRSKFIEVPYVGWSILDVCVSPDGRDVVYSTWNENIYQCKLRSGKDEYWQSFRVNSRDSRFSIFSLRFNNAGTEIVAGSTDGLYIYNREVNRCVLQTQAHEDDINAVCFGDAASHIILSGADDGLCKVWDRRTMGDYMDAKPVGVFAGHRDGITYIDSRGDDRYLLTNSKDQTIKIWDMRHFSSEVGIASTRHAVANQRWDYRWQCTPDDIFKMTNLAGDASVLTIRGHSVLNTLIRARFSPEHTGKRYIYTGCARGNCIVYDLYTGELLKKYPGHKSVVRDCMWHPTQNEIVTSSWDGETSLWKYDERSSRNINPDSCYNSEIGDEDSCDENYEPIRQRCVLRNRFKPNLRLTNSRSNIPVGPMPRSGLKIATVEPEVSEDESDDEEEDDTPTSYAAAAKKARMNIIRMNR